ncbi:MAG: ATP-binding cassette domain-containing protein [Pseudomonas sp.]|nr:ATP-binding cassette domain-containing protein [Pseudomonas sp.]
MSGPLVRDLLYGSVSLAGSKVPGELDSLLLGNGVGGVLAAPSLAESRAARVPDEPLDIEFCGLRHRYGERLALDGVSFTARAGQVTALVGPSGSGKSTLVRLVARLYELESGSLRVGGVDLREWPLDALLACVGRRSPDAT